MNLKDKVSMMKDLFPELQVYNCVSKFGFTEGGKIIKEGRVYINDKGSMLKNNNNFSEKYYAENILMYIYLFFLSLLSLLVFFAPVYFAMGIKLVLVNGILDNTCLIMFYEVGILAGFAMLVPTLRKIYDILPWMYIFIKIVCFDLLIMALTLEILYKMVGYGLLSLIIMFVLFILLRLIMCISLKRYNYYSRREFKFFGGIIFTIGIIGVILL